MGKKWAFIGITVAIVALLGLWIDGKRNPTCENCSQKETSFFQLFSAPTADAQAREKKFLSFTQQTYPFFRVAVTHEEASYPDVQAIMEKFPYRFAKLPDGYRCQELFYRWIHSVPPSDIVVLFPANQALDFSALERLKALYAGSAAWLAFQGDIKKWAHDGVLTGYANLFQKIKLQEFLERGSFSENKMPENRLFELAGRHVRRLRGNFIEGKSYGYSWIARSRKPYPRFRPGQESAVPQSDLVVFSGDRPLQLYAFLESVNRYTSAINQVTVIYTFSTPAYEKGYEQVKRQFPNVAYLKQGKRADQDFKILVLQATFQSPSSYVLFAEDDMVIRDFTDIREGIEELERTGAVGVYYRLGRHLNVSFMKNQPQAVPPSIHLGKTLWAWQFSAAEGEWKSPYTIDMALYKKEDIREHLISLKYTSPKSLENQWALKAKTGGVGIYYETSKALNISFHRQASQEELLTMFLGGLKLDIKPFQGYLNRSAHLDVPVSFVSQDETKR